MFASRGINWITLTFYLLSPWLNRQTFNQGGFFCALRSACSAHISVIIFSLYPFRLKALLGKHRSCYVFPSFAASHSWHSISSISYPFRLKALLGNKKINCTWRCAWLPDFPCKSLDLLLKTSFRKWFHRGRLNTGLCCINQ